MDVLAPAFNDVTIGYEQVIARNTNLTVKLGYIGIGIGRPVDYNHRNDRYQGALIKLGVKFVLPASKKGFVERA